MVSHPACERRRVRSLCRRDRATCIPHRPAPAGLCIDMGRGARTIDGPHLTEHWREES
jgi:hypothetical protein